MLKQVAMIVALCAFLPVQAAAQFFPPGKFSKRPDAHEMKAAWYSRHLTAMEEPSLLKAVDKKKIEIYRFIWLRTFHPPFAFRLEVHADGTGSLTAKSTNGSGGYDPGRLTLGKTLTLDAKRVRSFTSGLDTLGYWKLPTQDTRTGFDGAQWVLEGVKGGQYHVIDRWSPEDGPFRKLMLDFVALAGVKVNPVY